MRKTTLFLMLLLLFCFILLCVDILYMYEGFGSIGLYVVPFAMLMVIIYCIVSCYRSKRIKCNAVLSKNDNIKYFVASYAMSIIISFILLPFFAIFFGIDNTFVFISKYGAYCILLLAIIILPIVHKFLEDD